MSATAHHTGQRILSHESRNRRAFPNQRIELGQKRSTTGQHQAPLADVGAQLRRRVSENVEHRLHDFLECVIQCVAHFVAVQCELRMQPARQAAPVQLDLPDFLARIGAGHLAFDDLSLAGPDRHPVVAPHVLNDGVVHAGAPGLHGARVDDAGHRQHGHLRGAAADIHNHVAAGPMYRQTGANRRDYGLVHDEYLARPGVARRLLDRPAVHRSGAMRNTNHQPPYGGAEETQAQGLDDEMLEHLLGDFVVGDHAVLQGLDDLQIARGAAQHSEGFGAYRQHPVVSGAGSPAKRHDGRFVQDDASPANVHKCICGAEVYGEIHGQTVDETTDKIAHRASASPGVKTPQTTRKS